MCNKRNATILCVVLMLTLRCDTTCFGEEPPSAEECLDRYLINCEQVRANYALMGRCTIAGRDETSSGSVDMEWFQVGRIEPPNDNQAYVEIQNFYSSGINSGFWERYLIRGADHWMSRGASLTAPFVKQRKPEFDENGRQTSGMVFSYRPPNPLTMSWSSAVAYSTRRDSVDQLGEYILRFDFSKQQFGRYCIQSV